MGTINRQTLATSTPLNLNTGFPIFPVGTTAGNPRLPIQIGIGNSPGSNSFTLVDSNIPLLLWRIRASFTAQLVSGAFFGFNLQYTIQGVTRPDGTAQLTVSGDRAQGGLGFGLGLNLSFSFRLESLRTHFSLRTGFTTTWDRVFNLSPSVSIDLINLGIRLLRALGLNIPLVELPVDVTIGSGVIYGLFDSPSSQLGSTGRLVLRPGVNVSGNLLKLIPQLRGFLKAVKNAGGKVTVGPGLNITFPITITIVRLSTEDGNYLNGTFSGGAFNFTGGPRVATSEPIQDVRVTHSHTVGLAFGLEFKASASLWSIFNVSATRTINPPFRTGTIGNLGPFFTALENKPVAAKLPEVVWG